MKHSMGNQQGRGTTRRAFLKQVVALAGVSAGTVLLDACGSPTATQPSAATGAATAAGASPAASAAATTAATAGAASTLATGATATGSASAVATTPSTTTTAAGT